MAGKINDERLFEVIDMLSREKYYFRLWNKFVLERGPVFDRDIKQAWKHFFDSYGNEVKGMQTEALVAQHIVHCWELGLLDAQEVYRLRAGSGILVYPLSSSIYSGK